MADENIIIILQIMFITLALVIFGRLFNKFFGLTAKGMKKIREQARNLQERFNNARLIGDPQMLLQVQTDIKLLTKQMMKRQFLPMCLRCFIFLGIIIVLMIIYTPYGGGILPFPLWILGSGWFAIYFLFSLGFSLLFYSIKKIYKKMTGKEEKSASFLRELMSMIVPTQNISNGMINLQNPSGIHTSQSTSNNNDEDKENSWKDRLDP